MEKIEFEIVEGLIGRKVTGDESNVIDWLNRLDSFTRKTVQGLLESSHRFGYVSGEVDSRHKTNQ